MTERQIKAKNALVKKQCGKLAQVIAEARGGRREGSGRKNLGKVFFAARVLPATKKRINKQAKREELTPATLLDKLFG